MLSRYSFPQLLAFALAALAVLIIVPNPLRGRILRTLRLTGGRVAQFAVVDADVDYEDDTYDTDALPLG